MALNAHMAVYGMTDAEADALFKERIAKENPLVGDFQCEPGDFALTDEKIEKILAEEKDEHDPDAGDIVIPARRPRA
jgi:hypothetical protein